MARQFALIFIFVCLLAVSFSVAKEIVGFQKLPVDWSLIEEKLSASKEITLKLALSSKGKANLERTILEISTPKSKSFRKYLSKSQIADIVGLSETDIKRVTNWLSKNGAKSVSVHPHRDWISATSTVENIEALFSCKLATFVNKRTSNVKISAQGSYSIPDDVSDIVDFVSGMTTFPSGRWQAVSSSKTVSADTAVPASITPDSIYDLYQVEHTGTHGSKLGSQAVVEFGNFANFNYADLQTFFQSYQTSLVGETCGVVYGTNNGVVKPSVEANLDVQYMMAAGVYINTTDYKITGTGGIEDEFLSYTTLVNSQIDPPLVHSISYGEYGGSYDNATDQRFSYELQKMGVAGISVLLASGDNGVGCNADGTSEEFDYPSSPYITMVGATYLDSVTGKEVGATLSSGGFSLDFMQASWQADAVNAYLNSGIALPNEYYYAPGRAYPDVAAFGQNVKVVASGSSEAVSGTSCSAPIFAGIIARLNSELLAAGKAPLGFLNPWLYANPTMFTDVVSGSNPYQLCAGFQAAAGWDPVTGLGTPIYPAMKTAAFASSN